MLAADDPEPGSFDLIEESIPSAIIFEAGAVVGGIGAPTDFLGFGINE